MVVGVGVGCLCAVGCGKKEAAAPPPAAAEVRTSAADAAASTTTALAAETDEVTQAVADATAQGQAAFDAVVAEIRKQLEASQYSDALAAIQKQLQAPDLTGERKSLLEGLLAEAKKKLGLSTDQANAAGDKATAEAGAAVDDATKKAAGALGGLSKKLGGQWSGETAAVSPSAFCRDRLGWTGCQAPVRRRLPAVLILERAGRSRQGEHADA